jgi:hypothetical protein
MPLKLPMLLMLLSGGSAAPAFSPSSIAGLVAWYDASDATTLFEDSAGTIPAADNADVIGRLADKSGNGYHLTQATTGNKPTLRTAVQNSKNVVRVDGSDDFLTNAAYADIGDNYTVFAVAKYASSVDVAQCMFDVSTGTFNTGFMMMYESATRWRGVGNSGNQNADNATDVRDGLFRIHKGVNTGSQLQYSLNGGAAATGVYTPPNGVTLNTLTVGRIVTASSYTLNGDIAELLIYNATLTAQQQSDMVAYLNAKWAVY